MKLTIEQFASMTDQLEDYFKSLGDDLRVDCMNHPKTIEILTSFGMTNAEWTAEMQEALAAGLLFRIPKNRFNRLASKFEVLFDKNMTPPVTEEKRLALQTEWKEALDAEGVTENQWLMEINRSLHDQDVLRKELQTLDQKTS